MYIASSDVGRGRDLDHADFGVGRGVYGASVFCAIR